MFAACGSLFLAVYIVSGYCKLKIYNPKMGTMLSLHFNLEDLRSQYNLQTSCEDDVDAYQMVGE